MKTCIEVIEKQKKANRFTNYIDYIVFPKYKNLITGSKITFDFPLTVLVGKNGSGKSSVLKALYGAPNKFSCGDYWFTTEVDPIESSNIKEEKNRFFYSYKKDDVQQEVLYQRMPRKGNPDYWETAKPMKSLGMTVDNRCSPIEKELIYLDFRSEITAFDKAFYFGVKSDEKIQDFLRKKSKYLKRAFNNEEVRYPVKKTYKTHEKLIQLNQEIIDQINKILEKNYIEIKILKHKFYDKFGVSILVKTKLGLEYSEANSGSGESAIINLVYNIMEASDQTLILLDEPESSLHPSAQKRLKLFLLEQIKKKRHQIILSTHSPMLIEGLPSSAIKLFSNNLTNNTVIEENRSYEEAFFDLSDSVNLKKTIICEDFSAKELITRILNISKKNHYMNVEIGGGAESILKKYVPIFSNNLENNFYIMLDGDKTKESINLQNETLEKLEDESYLKAKSKEVFGFDIPIYIDGGLFGGNSDQKKEMYKKNIEFHKNRVKYIPNNKIPEEIILSSTFIKESYKNEVENKAINRTNAKQILEEISTSRGENDKKLTIAALITDIVREDLVEIKELKEILSSILKMEME
ncbi:ATP-dependent nuclease [Cetobacterium sp.]|uniref:ATP-dependent nuclease n=1 Tax=Cetobacterium sp. TaxID=2071632 RepID=UPI003F39BFD2